MSHPTRGEWIEIEKLTSDDEEIGVSPHTG